MSEEKRTKREIIEAALKESGATQVSKDHPIYKRGPMIFLKSRINKK